MAPLRAAFIASISAGALPLEPLEIAVEILPVDLDVPRRYLGGALGLRRIAHRCHARHLAGDLGRDALVDLGDRPAVGEEPELGVA
jgi:hypothetical protein